MMRHDLQQGGLGLFTQPSPVVYTAEAANAPASAFNEVSPNPPRAFVAGNNLAATNETSSGSTYGILANTDYLSIKATTVARSNASQRWTYLQNVAGTGVVPNSWPSAAENFDPTDRVVLMQRTITKTDNALTIVPNGANFYHQYGSGFAAYSSVNASQYIMYGLAPSDTPRMPFNRTDYFVARPATATDVPAVCAPNTGVLYKTTVNNYATEGTLGALKYLPILDCVADMQVVFGWDLYNGASPGTDGLIDTYSNADGTARSGLASQAEIQSALADPAAIRNNLKMIKIYILAQNGRKDPSYISPASIVVGGPGETSLTKSFDIATAGWLNYRWKLYQIVVRPKNLTSNQ
jgi:hypothetical protein